LDPIVRLYLSACQGPQLKIVATAAALLVAGAADGQANSPCRATEVARNLDFWVGDWDVYTGTTLAGRDKVERVLGGCGMTERWKGGEGDAGISLFAYDARKDFWTQTWITDNSAVPGGLKVKVLRAHSSTSTTFQGEIEGRNGAIYYDRTILTALPGGRVHQEIQVSHDGVAWRTGFDAIYVPHGQKP
jgi:hypothetical protein